MKQRFSFLTAWHFSEKRDEKVELWLGSKTKSLRLEAPLRLNYQFYDSEQRWEQPLSQKNLLKKWAKSKEEIFFPIRCDEKKLRSKQNNKKPWKYYTLQLLYRLNKTGLMWWKWWKWGSEIDEHKIKLLPHFCKEPFDELS